MSASQRQIAASAWPFAITRDRVRKFARNPLDGVRKVRRLLRRMPKEYRQRFNLTLKDWLVYHEREIVYAQMSWMGVPILKNPLDLWIYQEILTEVRPEVVVEIGSFRGGSALYLAHLLDLLGGGTVVSVDLDHSRFEARHPNIVLVTGDSGAPEIVARVSDICRGKRVLVIQDGDHEKQGVLRDLRNYSGLVPVGSYFIVEDGISDLFSPHQRLGTYEEGPLAAIDAFLAATPAFVVDGTRERYVLTYNPRGFLKRIAP